MHKTQILNGNGNDMNRKSRSHHKQLSCPHIERSPTGIQSLFPPPAGEELFARGAGRTISKGVLRTGIIIAALALQGCASLTHYNAVRDLEGVPGERSEVLLMDAKQRLAYPTRHEFLNEKGEVIERFRAFCAEPSPDALSNLAAQFGAKVSVAAKADGSINGGFAEGAANIGLRTTSIQILRDITYRQCEAYANGGISRLGLETLQRRFQSTMVALLSIEQLTGAIRAPAVVLAGKATGADAELIAGLTEKTIAARTAVTKSESEVMDKDKGATDKAAAAKKLKDDFDKEKGEIEALRKDKPPAGSADRKKVDEFDAAKAAKEKAIADADADSAKAAIEMAAAKTALGERKEALDAMSAALTAAHAAGGQASTSGEIRPIVIPSTLDSNAAIAVADAVTNIVRDTLSLGYGREVCTSIIGDQTDPARAKLLASMATQAALSSTSQSQANPPANAESNSAAATANQANATVVPKAAPSESTPTAQQNLKSALQVTAKASESVLQKCLDLIGADAGYYAKLERHLDAKTALINAVATSITKCASDDGCAKNTETVKALVKALQIASEMKVDASPVLLTKPTP